MEEEPSEEKEERGEEVEEEEDREEDGEREEVTEEDGLDVNVKSGFLDDLDEEERKEEGSGMRNLDGDTDRDLTGDMDRRGNEKNRFGL